MNGQTFVFDNPINNVDSRIKLETPKMDGSPPRQKVKVEGESPERENRKCSIKFNFNGDLRRILVHTDDTTFRVIVAKVKEIYPSTNNPELYYTDDEGDSLKITGDDELVQAFDLFPKILKISVVESGVLLAQRVEPTTSKVQSQLLPTRETRSSSSERSTKKRSRSTVLTTLNGSTKKKRKGQKIQGHVYAIGGNRLHRSPPSQWVGEPIKKVGTKVFYSGIMYQEVTYHVGDVALLNSNVQPFPIGRIISMWEQAKKRWVSVNWFFRADEVRQIMTTMREGNLVSESTIATTLEYISKSNPQEVFITGHKDDNYPSTLEGKVEVKHVDEIPNLSEYLSQDSRQLFYNKYFDLNTFEITSAKLYRLSPLDAMDFDLTRVSIPTPPIQYHHIHQRHFSSDDFTQDVVMTEDGGGDDDGGGEGDLTSRTSSEEVADIQENGETVEFRKPDPVFTPPPPPVSIQGLQEIPATVQTAAAVADVPILNGPVPLYALQVGDKGKNKN